MPEAPYTLLHGLRSAAFPGSSHPDALVYLPGSACKDGLAVVIYFHGWDNCVESAVSPHPRRCNPYQDQCASADLIGHLERSGRGAMLLLPELSYHKKSSDPGALGKPGALAALLEEVLQRMRDATGGVTLQGVSYVVLASHSGGYRAAASLVVQGGVPVQELYLLDSHYGEEELFDRYVEAGLQKGDGRLVNLYTTGGGTRDRSRAMAGRIRGFIKQAGLDSDTLCEDDGEGPISDEDLKKRFVFKRVDDGHSDIPINFMGRLLQNSGLP